MAYTTGTATDYRDLLDKLLSFLTTNSDLTDANQQWQVLADSGVDASGTRDVYLKAPGLDGNDEIYTQIRSFEDSASDYYNWQIAGATGYLSSADFNDQPGKASDRVYWHLWNDTIPYWFVANGRRVIAVAKVSTVYQAFYMGYILPYATPGQYPYPLMIGGTSSQVSDRWSATNENHRMFTDPGRYGCRFRLLDGTWQAFSNFYNYRGRESDDSSSGRYIWPYGPDDNQELLRALRENVDGGYTLLPLVLAMNDPSNNVLGEMDGCYWVSGAGNASENLITIGGVDHLVVQNVFRTGRQYYWALRLS